MKINHDNLVNVMLRIIYVEFPRGAWDLDSCFFFSCLVVNDDYLAVIILIRYPDLVASLIVLHMHDFPAIR